MTSEGTSDDPSRWRADAAAYDARFDQPWGRYASSIEHDLLFDAIEPVAGLDVCDAGCGTGRFTARLEAEPARVVGVDADPASLVLARTRVIGELVETDVLVHTASPFPAEQPKDPRALIRPAVDGTLSALRAARRPRRRGAHQLRHLARDHRTDPQPSLSGVPRHQPAHR